MRENPLIISYRDRILEIDVRGDGYPWRGRGGPLLLVVWWVWSGRSYS